ncbi:uncharacterized protein N7483_008841 [Penicillium malachiteum]|uniref:uncharacterized protein n=1 Tax=Penicillium malachiteum TaxID=1324776 RepID=UPI00254963C2|nr:uncharacterized protein N7483_008841 [Penicillium malachiteum]KAJ5720907.1 hypothetical protein N7483_008841 [Penicillium malachiteum]
MRLLLTLLGLPCQAVAKAVFAHFMMANTAQYDVSDWKRDISLAKEAHLDAFALNMAYGMPGNEQSAANAFLTAEDLGFQLFFSFDYAGNGSWPQSQIIYYLQKYASSPAYYKHQKRTFVSTFEGPENANDWIAIKNQTNCFLVPDWSSVGATAALKLAGGVVDGLFSWAAWPTDSQQMNTYVDASYLECLRQAEKPYMMPVSPWFYTNMPEYHKNWAVHGGDLWYDRWVEISFIQPEWVEVISWNDFGESHYIGPLNSKGYGVFTSGKAPYNYAENMPHDGWRLHLPYVIDTYRTGMTNMTEESLVVWYRTEVGSSCSGGNTTGFTSTDLQIDTSTGYWVKDKIFFSALLASNASVKVTIGGKDYDAKWEYEPDGGIGVYHGNFGLKSEHLGETTILISREDEEVVHMDGRSLTSSCTSGFINFNAWVGSATSGKNMSAVSPELALSDQVCIEGSGSSNYTQICEFTCEYGYCPIDTCYCTAMGAGKKRPKATKKEGEPRNGDDSFEGLCSFACYYGFCPKDVCYSNNETASAPPPAPSCTSGKSNGKDSSCGHHTSGHSSEGSRDVIPSLVILVSLYLAISLLINW